MKSFGLGHSGSDVQTQGRVRGENPALPSAMPAFFPFWPFGPSPDILF